jgi:hypothetical protein
MNKKIALAMSTVMVLGMIVSTTNVSFATSKSPLPQIFIKMAASKKEYSVYKQLFLTNIPPLEPYAPNDMKWIVEHAAGDGGYYPTKYFPGYLYISKQVNWNEKPVTLMDGQQTWASNIRLILWAINQKIYGFIIFKPQYIQMYGDGMLKFESTGYWEVAPYNKIAQNLIYWTYN